MRPCLALLLAASAGAAEETVDPARLERTVRAMAAFGTRHSGSGEPEPGRGIEAARRWLAAEFVAIAASSDGRLTVEAQDFDAPPSDRLRAGARLSNVYARLRGTHERQADRLYVVSGHYDSRASDAADALSDAPGANDDASGVAVVLELARLFARSPPPSTLIFLCVPGEEQGLLGATHFVKQAREKGWRIEGMFTNDIVGNSRGRDGKPDRSHVRLFSDGIRRSENPMEAKLLASMGAESDSPSRQLARFAAAHAPPGFAIRLVFRPDRFLRGGDQMPFHEAGFPAARFTEPFEDYDRQHQDLREEEGRGYGDTPEFVDFAYLALVARANASVLEALATAPAPPPRVRIHTARLENDTTLSWDASPGAAAYEVVWRATTEPDWTGARRVEGLGTTLPLSKDDLHFGVRALGQDGRASPVAFALPFRG
ncbi:MAG: M20/M25/M40 family metallo-hydrolase [Planctomycetaceae bacterium]